MSERLSFHPVASLFPLLEGGAFESLVADIKKNGLLGPILVDAQRRILDGRNRYLACLEAGVQPRFTEWRGGEPPPELALSWNLHRRHLNESQRALVGARLAKLWEMQGFDSVANLRRKSAGRVCERAGRLVNVSARLITYALKVLDQGCPELVAAVECGRFKVSLAAGLAGLPRERQAEEVAGGPRHDAQTSAEPIGSFGRLPQRDFGAAGFDPEVRLLWVTAGSLSLLIQTLKRRGFRYERPARQARRP